MAISRMRRYAKVIAFLAICTVGISGCGRERGAAELPFFGTWYIEKVAVISEMYTGTTKDGVAEEGKYVIIRICQQLYFSDTLFS